MTGQNKNRKEEVKTEESGNIFELIVTPEKAKKVKAISDAMIAFDSQLETLGADRTYINKMLSSVSLAELSGEFQ